MLERTGLVEGETSAEEVVVAYHERTKHHFHRYAASLGYMDWATQPDPFRRYAGADLVRLPLPKAGIRATGIGCYFDDPVHAAFGIDSREWQSFYHFTVGGPVEDSRLTTLPAYDFEALVS